jgi:hypothetical protein
LESWFGAEYFLLVGVFMKKVIILLFILCFSLFALCAEQISLVSTTGVVQIKMKENGDWIKASAGQKLETGYFIYTGFNSTAVIQAANAKIEVKSLSQVSIASLISTKNNVTTDVYLKYGKIKANVIKNEEVKTNFKVRSANSTASVRGTIFTFGENTLFVENGTVELINDYLNSLLVQQGESAYVGDLNIIDSPFKGKLKDYFVDVRPVGLSDTETDSPRGTENGRRGSTIANVIIKIEVIK